MYKIKKEVSKKYQKYGDVREIANQTEYSENYISQILNGRIFHRKMLAYIITKTFSSELEISDLFKIF